MSKRQSGESNKSDVLWDKVFELQHHVLELVADVTDLIMDNKVLHPESALAQHLLGAENELNDAINDAMAADEGR